MTSPNPADPNSGGNPLDPLANGITAGVSAAGSSIGGAVGNTILGALGLKVNTINILLNTVFYASLVTVGGIILYKGLRLIVNESGGSPPGVGEMVKGAVRKVTDVAALIPGLDEVGIPARVAESVVIPKRGKLISSFDAKTGVTTRS